MESNVDDKPSVDREGPWAPWKARITASRQRRDQRVDEWRENVERRQGYPSRTGEQYDRIAVRTDGRVSVNQDAPLTKAKIAQLYSQTPEVRLTVRNGFEDFQPALGAFGTELNAAVEDASVGSTIEEVLADVVNAAGIGGVVVSCDKRTEKRMVPEQDPALLPPDLQQSLALGTYQIPLVEVDHVVDLQHLVSRISPADLLIPSDFTGSNYDHARWLGHDGRMTWAQAQLAFGLTDEQKDLVLGTDKRAGGAQHSLVNDTHQFRDTEVVHFTQIFYWRHYYHPEETSFKALQRLVFVDGIPEPVVDEDYKGQQRLEDGRLVGVMRNPIRVCTLTYISDESLPPSDSSLGRFQVDELEASRDAIVQQRKHSIPIRWYNPSVVSPNTRALLDKGTFNGFVPIPNGERGIGEVARASFPQERFEFDKIVKSDLTEIWQVGSNQAGAFASGERSAREAGIIEQNFQRRVGQEQDKVSRFFLGIAEVLAGQIALYGQFDLPDQLGPMRAQLANAFSYSIQVDSTMRLDAQQQIARLEKVIDRSAQSPYINAKPLMAKWLELNGVEPGAEGDPNAVLMTPQPKAPEPVKVSVSKAEDLMSPLFVALLMRTGQGPSPEDLAAAKKLLAAAGLPIVPTVPVAEEDPRPPRDGEAPGIANPDWQMAPRQDKRDEDGGA